MNPETSPPSPMLRRAAGAAKALLWLLLGAGCLVALSWGALHWVIVPRVGNWKAELEQVATRTLGIRMQIGALRAEPAGLLPRLELSDVRLFDAQGREALRLQRVLGTLSPRSLLSQGFEQLAIDAPAIELRRRTDGVLTVAGITLSAAGGPSAAADWFFSQREFMLRDGRLRWTDELRPQAPPLELREVGLLVRNPGRRHEIELDLTPPPEWGQRLSLRGRFSQPLLSLAGASDWSDWSGQLDGDFSQIRLPRLREYLAPGALRAVELQDGAGALRFLAELRRGQWTGFSGDLALQRLALRLGPGLKPLALSELGGHIELRHEGDELELTTQGLTFRTEQGQVWSGGKLRYQETRTEGELRALQLQGDRIDLRALHQLASHLPLPDAGRRWLERLQPGGQIEKLDLQWRAGRGPQGQWQAKGRVSDLSLQAEADRTGAIGRPGLSGANLDFEASEAGGQARLGLERGALDFPGVFEAPRLDFDRLRAELRWRIDGERIEVDLPRLDFANADAAGSASARWRTADPQRSRSGRRFPGQLELDAALTRADGTRVHRYLPLGVGAEARGYVRDAVRRGRSTDARFRVRGDLWDFPFTRPGSGEFSVRAALSGVELDYVPRLRDAQGAPAWPALEQISAELQISGNSLAIVKGRAQVAGLPLLRASQVEARIDDLAHQPQLRIEGQIAGPAADALAFVNRSPLLGMTGHALEQARIDGQTEVRLRLDLPLQQVQDTRVDGLVQFPGNDMRFTPDTPTLATTSGTLRFSEQGFSVAQARTQLLGGELAFEGGMTAGEPVSFRGQGKASAAGLRQASEWAALATLGQIASGNTDYEVKLEFHGPAPSLALTSNLRGLALALPAPLGKSTDAPLPMRFQIAPSADAGGRWHDLLSLDLGPPAQALLSARYEREHEAGSTRVLRGALALGTPRPNLPARGVLAKLDFDQLLLDDWQETLDELDGGPTPTTALPRSHDASRPYWPDSIALRTQRIEHEGRSFHDLKLNAAQEQGHWRGNVEARQLKGRFDYTPPDADSPGRIHARLEHLSLPHSAASEIEQLTQQAPVRLPALDIVVQDFELGTRKLGRLEIEAVNQMPNPAQREAGSVWRLDKLDLDLPEARLRASGNWAIAARPRGSTDPVQRRTALRFKLELDDAGALLARLGMPGVVRGGQGQLSGQIGWLGSPLALHPPSLGGELELGLERGQFLQADPGLAKLLGVLSLQALPRRLALDFRDLFSEGFAFDFVRGEARIAEGVISSDKLQMKGVNAVVLLAGSADLAQETQDMRALVIPELNAEGASLLASFAHPVIGLSSLIAQYLIGKPLQEAATQQFHITGSWTEPKVEKIDRAAVKLEPNTTGGRP